MVKMESGTCCRSATYRCCRVRSWSTWGLETCCKSATYRCCRVRSWSTWGLETCCKSATYRCCRLRSWSTWGLETCCKSATYRCSRLLYSLRLWPWWTWCFEVYSFYVAATLVRGEFGATCRTPSLLMLRSCGSFWWWWTTGLGSVGFSGSAGQSWDKTGMAYKSFKSSSLRVDKKCPPKLSCQDAVAVRALSELSVSNPPSETPGWNRSKMLVQVWRSRGQDSQEMSRNQNGYSRYSHTI